MHKLVVQNEDNKTKVNKNRNLSTLEDVATMQGLQFPGWHDDTQEDW